MSPPKETFKNFPSSPPVNILSPFEAMQRTTPLWGLTTRGLRSFSKNLNVPSPNPTAIVSFTVTEPVTGAPISKLIPLSSKAVLADC